MEEKELKTSTKQRVVIALIALIMVGTMVASYAAIVINGSKSSSSSTTTTKLSDERIKYYSDAYNEALAKFKETSSGDYAKFASYLGEIKTFDEAAANEGGVAVKDLMVGEGRELAAGDTDYLAYFVGYCADGKVFDSSLDSTTEPKAFTKALNVSIGMIEGWNEGVVGMRLGGVRRLTIPGAKAYGEQMEICGGYNKPLRFIVMAVANEEPLKGAASAVDNAFMKLQYANYGIDYEAQMQSQAQEQTQTEGQK